MLLLAVSVAVAIVGGISNRNARFATAAALAEIGSKGRGRFPGGTDADAVRKLTDVHVIREVGGGYYEPQSVLTGEALGKLVVDDNGNLYETAVAA